MKVSSFIPVLLLFAAGAIAVGAKNRAVNTLAARSFRIFINKFNFINSKPIVQLLVQNASSTEYLLNSIIGEVYVNNQKIGNISAFPKIKVAPNSETTFDVEVKIKIGAIVRNLQQLLTNVANAPVKIAAMVNVDNKNIPLTITYNR